MLLFRSDIDGLKETDVSAAVSDAVGEFKSMK